MAWKNNAPLTLEQRLHKVLDAGLHDQANRPRNESEIILIVSIAESKKF